MPNEPKPCWGGCGRLLVFITKRTNKGRRAVAFDAVTGQHHRCPRISAPRIFIEAMEDFSRSVNCAGCDNPVWEASTRDGIMQFEPDGWKWHNCPRPDGLLNDIWYLPVESLKNACHKSKLPEPHQFVVVVCEKPLAGNHQQHLVALKSIFGNRYCTFFIGTGQLQLGALAVLGGTGEGRRLITASSNQFSIWTADGDGEPGYLQMPSNWL